MNKKDILDVALQFEQLMQEMCIELESHSYPRMSENLRMYHYTDFVGEQWNVHHHLEKGFMYVFCQAEYCAMVCWPNVGDLETISGYYCSVLDADDCMGSRITYLNATFEKDDEVYKVRNQKVKVSIEEVISLFKRLESLKKKKYEKN